MKFNEGNSQYASYTDIMYYDSAVCRAEIFWIGDNTCEALFVLVMWYKSNKDEMFIN